MSITSATGGSSHFCKQAFPPENFCKEQIFHNNVQPSHCQPWQKSGKMKIKMFQFLDAIWKCRYSLLTVNLLLMDVFADFDLRILGNLNSNPAALRIQTCCMKLS